MTAEGWRDLWMLPILLLALIFETFRTHLVKLKDMRHSRPMPRDWQSFYSELRQSEWAIHRLCFEGARQLIIGGELDLSALSYDPEPPESFQPSKPRSALSMHKRMEDIARFHADPERWIRRQALRLARNCDRSRPEQRPRQDFEFVEFPIHVELVESGFVEFPNLGRPHRDPRTAPARPAGSCPCPLPRGCAGENGELRSNKPTPTACSRNKHSAGANPA